MQYFSHMPQNNRENLISKYYRKNASIKESNIKTSKKIINNLQERVHRKNDKLF